MESVIRNLQERAEAGRPLTEQDFKILVDLFREKGVSVMALETLAAFFSTPVKVSCDVQEEAFMLPESAAYTSNDILRQKVKRLEYDINKSKEKEQELKASLKKQKNITYITAALAAVSLIIMIVAIIMK